MRIEKLIRDKIIEIASSKGHNIQYRIAKNEEYQSLLLEKLKEEVNEFVLDRNEEEIADILEVIDSIVDKFGFNKAKILHIKEQKKIERGGFEQNIIGIFENDLNKK